MSNNKTKYFLLSIITLGILVCSLAVYYLPFERFDSGLFFLSAATILFAARLSIQFPDSKVHFTMGDALIFLTFLLYGGEMAIILAATEAFFTSLRLKRQGVFTKFSTVLQNAGIMACSTAVTYAAVLLYSEITGSKPDYNNLTEFFGVLGLMALVQFFTNNILIALCAVIKGGQSFSQTFVEKCLSGSVIYIGGAAFAGIAYQLIEHFSSFAIIIAAIVVGLLYVTYRHYIAEIKQRQEQAEQAERERAEAERRRIEEAERHVEALLESQQMLQLVMDNIPQHVFWKDRNSVYLGCNRNFTEVAGVKNPHEIVGKTDYDLVWKKEEADLFRQYDARIMESGEPEYHIREFLHKADGAQAWLETNKVPLRNLQGEIIGILGTFENITESVLHEEERLRLQDQLQQAQKMESIGTLAGGIAHDFNNLLTVIIGNKQLAQRKLDPNSPVNPRLEEIEIAANRAAALTRQLLAFSRRQTLERKNINLNDVINDTMKMLRRLISEEIEVQIKETFKLSQVYADPQQIGQILMNLAINSRDAMPEGGRLVIETRNTVLDYNYCSSRPYTKPGNYVEISVRDTGTGMDAETRQRIFEPFFTTKEVGMGTGLGLSVVYGIVKQHDGFIEAESEPGNGTTFKIYLPVTENPVENDASQHSLIIQRGTETILVAEDEPSLRALAQDILEDLGYRVLLAENGEEALEKYKSHHKEIDLVLMDVIMPGKSGPETYKQMKEFAGEKPVIFTTGYSDDVVQSKFIRQHDIMRETRPIVLQKPYGTESLALKVNEALEKSLNQI